MAENQGFVANGGDRQQRTLSHEDEQSTLVYGTFHKSTSVTMDHATTPQKPTGFGNSANGVNGGMTTVGITLYKYEKITFLFAVLA
jgi:hypothetical protein